MVQDTSYKRVGGCQPVFIELIIRFPRGRRKGFGVVREAPLSYDGSVRTFSAPIPSHPCE
jgi:hypothetical protein